MTAKYNTKTVTVSFEHVVEALKMYLVNPPYSLNIDEIKFVKLDDDTYLDDFETFKVTYFVGDRPNEG